MRALQDLRIEFEIATDRIAKAAGLNPRDLAVLDVLHADGPATPRVIATRTGIHPATLTAILARLESAGHVSRTPHPDDARSAQIAITPATRNDLAARFTDIDQRLLERIARLDHDEMVSAAIFLSDITLALRS